MYLSYDAGYGSDLNADGFVEMDALIMDGSNLKAGAVAGIRYALSINCAHSQELLS
jgi:isoaspartyl peptidase/L-asparaginase-like protein (Ntn-hydrolase superfamily)